MRLTEFWERMQAQFGAVYADAVARDQVLEALGSRTAEQALAAGQEPKEVWVALCDAFEVPSADR